MEAASARPLDPEQPALHELPLQELADRLLAEEMYDVSGRASQTLVHGSGLTIVLTTARAGTRFDEHVTTGPTLLVPLAGRLTATSSDGEEGTALAGESRVFTIGANVRVSIDAETDCTFLTIIGEQPPRP